MLHTRMYVDSSLYCSYPLVRYLAISGITGITTGVSMSIPQTSNEGCAVDKSSKGDAFMTKFLLSVFHTITCILVFLFISPAIKLHAELCWSFAMNSSNGFSMISSM